MKKNSKFMSKIPKSSQKFLEKKLVKLKFFLRVNRNILFFHVSR
jgi:hypothetical protein